MVGPWRPVALVRQQNVVLEKWTRRTEIAGTDGIVHSRVDIRIFGLRAHPVAGWLSSGDLRAEIVWDSEHCAGEAKLTIPNVRRWWPHTHGEPVLYPLRLELELSDGSSRDTLTAHRLAFAPSNSKMDFA